jgi:hypothetical protein
LRIIAGKGGADSDKAATTALMAINQRMSRDLPWAKLRIVS